MQQFQSSRPDRERSLRGHTGMYQFAHLLGRKETHDVVFMTSDGEACVGLCKTLLLGVSEVWNSRDGECV